MAIGGFLGNLGLAAGNNIIEGQQLDAQRASTELKQQQVQMNKMSMLAQQKQQQNQQQIGAYIASEAQKDSSIVTDPQKMAATYEKAAGMALQTGDFAGAEEMSKLASGKLQESKDAAVVAQQQQQVKKESLASAADDYAANPSPEASKALVQKAVDAGVSPLSIPAPGTPAFKAWSTQQQLASKTASQRADFVQKAYEADTNRRERQQEHQDSLAERDATRRQTAAYQAGLLDLRRSEAADRQGRAPTTKDVAGSTYEWDPTGQKKGDRNLPDTGWVKIGGVKLTSTQNAQNNAIVASASEGMRGLRIIGAMDNDTTAGPFAGLHDGTILDAIAKTGTNAVTPADMQIYHTATAGMGLEIARTMTLGGGRGANQATINEMQNIVEGHSGDTQATLLFKYANAADIIRNRLSTLPDTDDPKVKAQRTQLEKDLAKIPEPTDILKSVKDPKQREHLLGIQGNMATTAQQMASEAAQPATGISTNTPSPSPGGGLPTGWSVQEH